MIEVPLEFNGHVGRLCFDGRRVYLENADDELRIRIEPYLAQELEYRSNAWVDGRQVRQVHRAVPGTNDHFSALVNFYLPFKAKVKVLACWC
ncbi:MAG: hypothetical protein AB1402_04420 [Bacillota bacterium]|jgi:hypothetical protein